MTDGLELWDVYAATMENGVRSGSIETRDWSFNED